MPAFRFSPLCCRFFAFYFSLLQRLALLTPWVALVKVGAGVGALADGGKNVTNAQTRLLFC